MSLRFVRIPLCLLGLVLAHAAAAEEDPHAAHRRATQSAVSATQTRVALPDVVLRDARGKPFRLRPESFGGRVVVVDFVYTTCTTICPALSAVMASAQRGLGEQLGKDVLLVSISVDPVRDTPAVLRAYADRVGAKRHWLWLTGSSGDIARVLRAFGLSPGQPDAHPPLILVGDPARGEWSRWVGVPTPVVIADSARAMIARRTQRTGEDHDAHAHE